MTNWIGPWRETVRDEWIDYNGHLSEAYYVLVLGHATDLVMDRIGLDPAHREATGTSLFTVEAHIRYLDQVSRGEELQVRSCLVARTDKLLHIWHELWAGDRLRATEEILGVHVDAAAGRATPYPDEVAARIDRLLSSDPPEHSGRRIDLSAPRPHLGQINMVNTQHADGISRTWAPIPASAPVPWPSASTALPQLQIVGAGTTLELSDYLARLSATSLIVSVDDQILWEWYAPGLGPADAFLGASMTKSLLATLTGIAVEAGALGLEGVVRDLVPELADSGYADVTVLDLLTMTTGTDWVEDHRDPDGPASRLLGSFGAGSGGSRDLLGTVGRGCRPGSRWIYNTADSQVLDWVRERATGQDFVTAATELWRRLGAESTAYVAKDAPDGVALAGGGLVAATRDWLRLGHLHLDGTTLTGDRLLGQEWLTAVGTAAHPFTAPGMLPSDITTHAGFSRHWWPVDDSGVRFMADGSRGQFCYVDRSRRVVVLQTSQWDYADSLVDRQCRDLAYLALPTIAEAAAR